MPDTGIDVSGCVCVESRALIRQRMTTQGPQEQLQRQEEEAEEAEEVAGEVGDGVNGHVDSASVCAISVSLVTACPCAALASLLTVPRSSTRHLANDDDAAVVEEADAEIDAEIEVEAEVEEAVEVSCEGLDGVGVFGVVRSMISAALEAISMTPQ
jgi:hypothetical protein